MVRLLSYSIALLSAVAIATSAASGTAPQAKKQHKQVLTPDDATNPTPAPSTDHVSTQQVASWEVQPDGSVSSKRQVPTPSTDGSTHVQRDEDGRWRVVHYDIADEPVSSVPAFSPQQQPKDEPIDAQDAQSVLHVEEDGANEDWETDSSSQLFLDASDAFLTLEDRITEEGHTAKLVDELVRIANVREGAEDPETADDWAFAVTKLSFMQLFEPNAESTDEQAFIDAIHDLNVAAKAGVQSALGLLAMLDLVGVPDPEELENPSIAALSLQERRARADRALSGLSATSTDFMAKLAVAYGTLSGRIPVPTTNTQAGLPTDSEAVCEAALPLFHKCAEENVHIIVEEGGERPVEVVRLSDELLDPYEGGFFDEYGFGGRDPNHDENEALHELEYYRTIANNPMDEQYPQAMQRLGEIYFFGNPAAHVAADHGLAAQYFRQAADAGDPLAQANYGMLLANGMGVDPDVPQALVYFNRAARQNQAFAFHGLGVLYFTGNGVPQNVTRALEYFEEAIALGYAESHSFLGSAYLHSDGGVPIDYKEAFDHFQAAVDGTEGQSSQALFNLGVMHFQGIGTPRSCLTALPLFRTVALHPDLISGLPFSLVKAYECYKKGDYLRAYLHYRLVAELGDEDGQCNAAFLLEHHGDSVLKWSWLGLAKSTEDARNPPLHEAFALYSQAAALNDSEAIRKTGACFHEPWVGVCPSNHTRALERYQLAADLGDAQAGYKCGLMLLTGDGVPRDLAAARSYYADCSAAVFPANVPCALALVGLDILQVVEVVVRQVWVSSD
ncbi:Protein sel-1 3 [Phytophthora pseudosyringae]|uniref:Protein sel-1 3 n=1 Tax=Phytophthora pseudosyringae TaxID=221518 RepID=A0A8T1W678_9STRA|nr:Protein sel-1 3 [Phytophthora pseudosyringae]